MSSITTHEQALAAIHERSGYDRGFVSNPFAGDAAARLGLIRTQAMLDRLGNPERSYAIVHVAGSKGKGSTGVFTDAILRATGKRVGRYLSPHLHSWHERFVVDDVVISPTAFTDLASSGIAAAEAVEAAQPELGEITAFELTTAMALLHFRQERCEVAIVEVGLGGTLDATNVVHPAVSVITPLDYEHTAILGDTLAEIATNKAGIIKPGRPVVAATQSDEAMRVIQERADACGAPLSIAARDWRTTGTDRDFRAEGPWGTFRNLATSLPGQHQVANAGLAIAAACHIDSELSEGAVRAGLLDARLPGRFEIVTLPGGQMLVLDGAHTPAATRALATALRGRFPDQEIVAVIGLLQDKAPGPVLAPLMEVIARWITVTPDTPRAAPASVVMKAIGDACEHREMRDTVADGITTARDYPDSIIVVAGSLTTVADARAALGLA